MTRSISGVRRAGTLRGDTLQAVALRELGDAALWPDLAQLNKLVAPYLVDDLAQAGPGVLLAGQQVILIPAGATPVSGLSALDPGFGADVALPDGLLQPGADGDFAVVSDLPNLRQALRNRLVTHKSDLLFHPEYGCDLWKLLGQGGTATTDQLAAAYLAAALRSDTRVASVEGATARLAGDVISASAVAVAVDGQRLPTGLPSGAGVRTVLT